MHFSIATILLVSGLVASAPAPMERVIIMIDNKGNHTSQEKIDLQNNYNICYKVCSAMEPKCPDGGVSLEGFCYFHTTNSLRMRKNLANAGHAAGRTMERKTTQPLRGMGSMPNMSI